MAAAGRFGGEIVLADIRLPEASRSGPVALIEVGSCAENLVAGAHDLGPASPAPFCAKSCSRRSKTPELAISVSSSTKQTKGFEVRAKPAFRFAALLRRFR